MIANLLFGGDFDAHAAEHVMIHGLDLGPRGAELLGFAVGAVLQLCVDVLQDLDELGVARRSGRRRGLPGVVDFQRCVFELDCLHIERIGVRADRVQDDLALLRALPEHVRNQLQVIGADFRFPAQQSERLEERNAIEDAPVGHRHLSIAEHDLDRFQRIDHFIREGDLRRSLPKLHQLVHGDLGGELNLLGAGGDRADHLLYRATVLDVIHPVAEKEPVVQRAQFLALGKLIGRAEARDEVDVHGARSVVEFALIDQGQQRIQDGAVGLEDFVEERNIRFRELVRGHAVEGIVFQPLQAEWSEQLFGRAELGQQPLEVARTVDCLAQQVREHGLAGARRTEKKDVRARDESRETSLDLRFALDQNAVQLRLQRLDLSKCLLHFRVLLVYLYYTPKAKFR